MTGEQSPQQVSIKDLKLEIHHKLSDLTDDELEVLERFISESLDSNATPKQEQA